MKAKSGCHTHHHLRCAVLPASALLLAASALQLSYGQANGTQQVEAGNSVLTPANDSRGYVLRVTTREVLLEVVARDRNNQPINDLKPSEFEITETTGKGHADERSISGFRWIDPDSQPLSGDERHNLTVLPIGGRCEIRSTVHYELAFHPSDWSSGTHTVRVTTTRKHVTLSYRSDFYVGAPAPSQPVAEELKAIADAQLQRAACYHPDVPPSIPMSLTEMDDRSHPASRYVLSIAPDALVLAGINEASSSVRLDYGVCTFSRSGRILSAWRASVNKPLEAADRSAALSTGWTEELEVPRRNAVALTRFVVRDPQSGNMGSIDVVAGTRPRTFKPLAVSESAPRHRLVLPESLASEASQHVGGHLSLGSPLPAPNSLCGDVYELPQTTAFLPSDFKKLNAVGAVYTNALSIPESVLSQGVPGSTPRIDWFGVDYYGAFWVTKPGKYDFVLSADDGADLYIDEHLIINNDGIHPPQTLTGSATLAAGRHTIHLPYFQGPTYVSLILQVKPPDGILDVFDLRDYAKPESEASQ